MYQQVFIEYNETISAFQAVLTVLATALEGLLLIFLMAGIISMATADDEHSPNSNPVLNESPEKVGTALILSKNSAAPDTLLELRAALREIGISGISKLNKDRLKELWMENFSNDGLISEC